MKKNIETYLNPIFLTIQEELSSKDFSNCVSFYSSLMYKHIECLHNENPTWDVEFFHYDSKTLDKRYGHYYKRLIDILLKYNLIVRRNGTINKIAYLYRINFNSFEDCYIETKVKYTFFKNNANYKKSTEPKLRDKHGSTLLNKGIVHPTKTNHKNITLKGTKEQTFEIIDLYCNNNYCKRTAAMLRTYYKNQILSLDYSQLNNYTLRDDVGNRLYNFFTFWPNNLLNLITIRGNSVYCIDISNSQFLFLLSLLYTFYHSEEKNTGQPVELEGFASVAKKGNLHQFFMEKTGMSKSEIKGASCEFLFSKTTRGEVRKVYKEYFPDVVSLTDEYKKKYGTKGKEGLAGKLQGMESKVVVDTMLKELLEESIVVFSKHDSLLCEINDVEVVRNKFIEVMNNVFGEGNYHYKETVYDLTIEEMKNQIESGEIKRRVPETKEIPIKNSITKVSEEIFKEVSTSIPVIKKPQENSSKEVLGDEDDYTLMLDGKSKCWLLGNKYHRIGGPAIEWSDGDVSYYLNGVVMSKEKYFEQLKELI